MNTDINLNNVAMFIAAALQHPNPPCNGRKKWVSTIKVDQYKTKFNFVRIYCTLADPELVKKVMDDDPKFIEAKRSNLYADIDLEIASFSKQCLIDDARHYRKCYLSMMSLLPEDLIKYVKSEADYPELLCHDIDELNQLIDRKVVSFEKENCSTYCTIFNSRYDLPSIEDVRKYLMMVCF